MAWVVLAGMSCAAAIVVTAIASGDGLAPAAAPLTRALDWQAALGLGQPWRLWTSAWVHWSVAHLLVNVAGAAVVAFTGWRARLPGSAALAWFLAWPGTQLAMASVDSARLAAAMPHYGGLSGVLHAGAIVLGLSLAWPLASARPVSQRERWIGVAIVAGTLAKVVSEAPWDLAPRPSAALGIEVAPVAHACGVAAGGLAWALVRAVGRGR
jgi:membrane associated rhomboid family serine protease